MLLELKPIPRELLEGWESEIVETTALGDSWVSCTPTGHVETFIDIYSQETGNDTNVDDRTWITPVGVS